MKVAPRLEAGGVFVVLHRVSNRISAHGGGLDSAARLRSVQAGRLGDGTVRERQDRLSAPGTCYDSCCGVRVTALAVAPTRAPSRGWR